ncbi:MAG TPA: ECF-type sigma factor [Gemmataceae bacterium]|jgi:RNA polymerase sigma factor (TIGR02999 family)|nr:ECF-type sigma factor [Gemmataceae bacterium]
MNDVTRILKAIADGSPQAAEELLPLVYDELRRLAAQRLTHEKPGQTLQPTALVHEAYLRLVRVEGERRWDTCGNFFAAAAEAMRRILVESARRKHRLKRGGDRSRIDLEHVEASSTAPSEDLLAIDEALNRLAQEDPRKAELVKLRFFAGLSIEEAAQCLEISRATADRHWAYARAWLYDHLSKSDDNVSS